MHERIESESSVFYSIPQRYDMGLWADVFVLARYEIISEVSKSVGGVMCMCRNVLLKRLPCIMV